MDERKRASKTISSVLTIATNPWLLIAIFVIYFAYSRLFNVINPPDQNSVVLINMTSNGPIQFPIHVTLATESKRWSRSFETGRLLDNGGITVLAWDAPFVFGELEIKDGDDNRVAYLTLRPPARYSGALVIELSAEEGVKTAFNMLPSLTNN